MKSLLSKRPSGTTLKAVARDLLPPIALKIIKTLRPTPASPYGFAGDYPSFQAALADCKADGYLNAGIADVLSSRTQVLRKRLEMPGASGLPLESRSMQSLAAVLLAIARKEGRGVSILDLGGDLGTLYYQLRPYLGSTTKVSWVVCETAPMVQRGEQLFASEELRFIPSLNDVAGVRFDVSICSGTLQYIDNPYVVLETFARSSDNLLFNRMPLLNSPRDRIAVQRVDPALHDAAYPCWFFARKGWLQRLEQLGFVVALRWEVPQDTAMLDGQPVIFEGMLMRRLEKVGG
jgi:putative methyltransferase (TIGR04325 family)